MFGLFEKKDKKKKKRTEAKSEDVREAALAQFRKTEAELGPETIQEMRRALEYEQAKRLVKDAIDNTKSGMNNRDTVVSNIKDMIDKSDNKD